MKHTVTLEFNIISTDLADLEVEADSPEEARTKARAMVESDEFDYNMLDYYQSKHYESELADNTSEWTVV